MSQTVARSAVPLILRLALRDLKGGFAGFRIFLACIALGVAAITGVGSVSEGLSDGLARDSRTILGATFRCPSSTGSCLPKSAHSSRHAARFRPWAICAPWRAARTVAPL